MSALLILMLMFVGVIALLAFASLVLLIADRPRLMATLDRWFERVCDAEESWIEARWCGAFERDLPPMLADDARLVWTHVRFRAHRVHWHLFWLVWDAGKVTRLIPSAKASA